MATIDETNIFAPKDPNTGKTYQLFNIGAIKQKQAQTKEQYNTVKEQIKAGNLDQAYEGFTQLPFIDQMLLYLNPVTGVPLESYEVVKFGAEAQPRLKTFKEFGFDMLDPRKRLFGSVLPSPIKFEDKGSALMSGLAGLGVLGGAFDLANIPKAIISPFVRKAPLYSTRAEGTGGGGGISKGKGIASVISDDVARKIFNVDQEMDVLYDLNQRKKRLNNKYVYDESLDDKQYALLDKELESVNNAIQQVENKAINKIEKRFSTNIQSRTIPKLDPAKVDRPSLQNIEKVAVGKANKDIIKNVGAYVDSPGYNKIYEKSYGTEKFSTRLSDIFDNSDVPIDDPKYLSTYTRLMTDEPMTKVGSKGIASLNPLEIYEKSIMPPTTMALGSTQKPFFVNPKKLADKLDKSGAGEDFFKLRKDEVGYLDKLEESIMVRGYQPEPIRIEILPSGNTTISEGNHRLYRALSRNDNEVPVIFNYTGGAERLDTPFGINQLDSFIATGEKGYKTEKEFAKYIKDVEKTYKPASTKIADDIDKIAQGISNRQQQITKLQRELELEGGDMLPKTVKSTERKIARLMKEIDEMSK